MAVIEIEIFRIVSVKTGIWGHFSPLFPHPIQIIKYACACSHRIRYTKNLYDWFKSNCFPKGILQEWKWAEHSLFGLPLNHFFCAQTIHWTIFRRPQNQPLKMNTNTHAYDGTLRSLEHSYTVNWNAIFFSFWLTSHRRYDFHWFCTARKLKLHHLNTHRWRCVLIKMLLFHSFGVSPHLLPETSSFHSPYLCILTESQWCIVRMNWSNGFGATLTTHLHISIQCRYVVLFKTHPECLFWIFVASMDERMGIEMILRNHAGYSIFETENQQSLALYCHSREFLLILHFTEAFLFPCTHIFVLTDESLFIFEMNISIHSNARIPYYIPLEIPARLFIHGYASHAIVFFSTSLQLGNLCRLRCVCGKNFSQTNINWFNRSKSGENIECICTSSNEIGYCSAWVLHFVFALLFALLLLFHLSRSIIIRWANIIGKFATSLDSSFSTVIWYVNGILFVIHHFSLYSKKKSYKHARTHARTNDSK